MVKLTAHVIKKSTAKAVQHLANIEKPPNFHNFFTF